MSNKNVSALDPSDPALMGEKIWVLGHFQGASL